MRISVKLGQLFSVSLLEKSSGVALTHDPFIEFHGGLLCINCVSHFYYVNNDEYISMLTELDSIIDNRQSFDNAHIVDLYNKIANATYKLRCITIENCMANYRDLSNCKIDSNKSSRN